MDSDQVIRIALTVVTPILTAGIGIVALVIGDWRERRTLHGVRKLSFEDASRQVEFAADWFKTSREIDESPEVGLRYWAVSLTSGRKPRSRRCRTVSQAA